MEVEVLGVDGAPDGAVVSIRAGSQRKQAAVSALGSSTAPFRFGVGANGVNPFRIDLMQPAGSVKMALRPGEGSYKADLKAAGKGGKDVRVRFAVREAAKRLQETPAKTAEKQKLLPKSIEDSEDPLQAAAAVAKEYLDTHQLLPFVRALIQTVIRERPKDPYDFIANQFRAASDAAKEEEEEPGLKKANPEPPEPTVPQKARPEANPEPPEPTVPQKARPEESPSSDTNVPSSRRAEEVEPAVCRPAPLSVDAAPPTLPPASKQDLQGDGEGVPAAKASAPLQSPATKEEVEHAKGKARDALLKALLEGPEEEQEEEEPSAAPGSGDLEERAREALRASLSGGGDSRDLERRAREALCASLVHAGGQDLEARAREALRASLLDSGGNDLQERAREALRASLLDDGGKDLLARAREALRASLVDNVGKDLEGRAREALCALLVDGGEDADLEEAKLKAIEALDAALLSDDEDDKQAARAALEGVLEDEEAKQKARLALDQALAGDAGAKAPPPPPEDEELEAAKLRAQAALDAALVAGEEQPPSDDEGLEADKLRAQAALDAALAAGGEDEELEADKLRAQAALDAALVADEEPPPSEDEELAAAKLEAQAALDAALAADGEDEELEAVKLKAQAALDAVLAAGGEDEEIEADKLKAQAALDAALAADGEDEELEADKLKAQAALDAALAGEAAEEDRLKVEAQQVLQAILLPDEDDEAKERARSALDAALAGEEGAKAAPPGEDEDLEAAKLQAQAALDAALAGDDAEEDRLKAEAQEVLQAILLPDQAEDEELTKERARAALDEALAGPPPTDEDKLRAQSVLDTVLMQDAAPAAPAESPKRVRSRDEIKQLKESCRGALQAALLSPSSQSQDRARGAQGADGREEEMSAEELEDARIRAREALRLALVVEESTGPPQPKLTPTEVGDAKAKARMALEAAFLDAPEALGSDEVDAPAAAPAPTSPARRAERANGKGRATPEMEAAQAVQVRLGVAKERMTYANSALKDEVRRLNTSYSQLVQQRDALMSKTGHM